MGRWHPGRLAYMLLVTFAILSMSHDRGQTFYPQAILSYDGITGPSHGLVSRYSQAQLTRRTPCEEC